MCSQSFSLEFPRAYGNSSVTALFRCEPEDFQVDEDLGLEPSGEGEHVYLHIIKRGENTAWVADLIAKLAGVKAMDVGYCGRKDRHAVTAQWFSVYLPPKVGRATPDWYQLNSDSIKVLRISRHSHKLRKGQHARNHFTIRLRNLSGINNLAEFEAKILQVLEQGVPNYFGEQRFGRQGNNLVEAQELLVNGRRYRDRQKQGLMLSAARSYLFNLVLAERVRTETWTSQLDGEPESDPSGPLWGRGRSLAAAGLLELESQVLAPWSGWCHGLEHMGLHQERRALKLDIQDGKFSWLEGGILEICFGLAAGAFATSVLAELVCLESPHDSLGELD